MKNTIKAFAAWYFVGAFITNNYNLFAWSETSRFMLLFSAVLTSFSIFCVNLSEKEAKANNNAQ